MSPEQAISPIPLLILLAGLALGPATATGAESGPPWQWGSDGRGGIYASERDAVDGSQSDQTEARLRLRLWAARDFGERWHFRTRAAGTFNSEQDELRARLAPYRDSGTGVSAGTVTLDQLYLARRHEGGQVRLGRLTTGFSLPSVPAKSLDRNDSSNTALGWTDGLHFEQRFGEHWTGHAIAQYYHRNGTGNTVRRPLDFSGISHRAGVFLGLESRHRLGPVDWAMLSINHIPDALPVAGTPRDYTTATIKSAARWPVSDAGTQLVAAAEFGHAFQTPRPEQLSLDAGHSVSGNAWQATISLFDFRPGHHIGAVYGQAGGGWLISNDYRNNDNLFEIRYQYRVSPRLSMEVRIRDRLERSARVTSVQRQRDRDAYLRVTWRYP
jgi:hypothetical protein